MVYFFRQSSRIFDEQAEDLNYEKRKTDGLLQQLLPMDIIAKLKSGEQPSQRLANLIEHHNYQTHVKVV
jgi:hypothetical protein